MEVQFLHAGFRVIDDGEESRSMFHKKILPNSRRVTNSATKVPRIRTCHLPPTSYHLKPTSCLSSLVRTSNPRQLARSARAHFPFRGVPACAGGPAHHGALQRAIRREPGGSFSHEKLFS